MDGPYCCAGCLRTFYVGVVQSGYGGIGVSCHTVVRGSCSRCSFWPGSNQSPSGHVPYARPVRRCVFSGSTLDEAKVRRAIPPAQPLMSANMAIRLIQVHMCM